MRSVLSRSGITNSISAARIYRSQSAVITSVLTCPRHYTSGPEGHIRDTDSGFSKKEKAIEDQWIRTHDAEKIKKLREEVANQKKKLEELEENLDELSNKPKKD